MDIGAITLERVIVERMCSENTSQLIQQQPRRAQGEREMCTGERAERRRKIINNLIYLHTSILK